MNYSDTLVKTLNAIANDYAEKIEREVKAVLTKVRFSASVDAMKVTVIPGNSSKAPSIVIEVADYVNILDKRKLQWTKMPPIKELEKWSATVSFPEVPGYKNAAGLPPWKAKKRVIWAIAMAKKKFDKHKPKPWRRKSLSGVLKKMNEEVLIEFEKAIEQDMQMAITTGLKR